MSAFNIKSKVIANRDADPVVATNPELSQALLKASVGVENTTDTGTDIGIAGTEIRLVTVPSNARIHSLEYGTGDLGTSSLDIAVWYPTIIPQGGQNVPSAASNATLISSSTFATAIQGVDTSQAWTNAFGTDATPTLTTINRPLWELLSLATDPGIELDLGFTVRTAVVQNGYVGLRATYVD